MGGASGATLHIGRIARARHCRHHETLYVGFPELRHLRHLSARGGTRASVVVRVRYVH
jgi:hypothetical protein